MGLIIQEVDLKLVIYCFIYIEVLIRYTTW